MIFPSDLKNNFIMDNEEYPEQYQLDSIKNWDIKDVFNLIDFIENIWKYDTSIRKKWGKDKLLNNDTLFLELHTIGWSGNEDIINYLLSNQMFAFMWYTKWERGGHYYFEINPKNIGYKRVSDMAKEIGVSRQRIHRDKINYDWVTVGEKIKLCRLKKL